VHGSGAMRCVRPEQPSTRNDETIAIVIDPTATRPSDRDRRQPPALTSCSVVRPRAPTRPGTRRSQINWCGWDPSPASPAHPSFSSGPVAGPPPHSRAVDSYPLALHVHNAERDCGVAAAWASGSRHMPETTTMLQWPGFSEFAAGLTITPQGPMSYDQPVGLKT